MFLEPCDSRIIGTFVVSKNDYSVAFVDSMRLRSKAVMVEIESGTECYFMSILHQI